jgi:hypothetical protein
MAPVGMIAAVLWSLSVTTAPVHKSLDFVGFSRSERVNAWRRTVSHPQHNGLVDHYSLIQVFDTDSEHLLGVYRESGVRRTDARGNFVFTTETAQMRDNPEWAQAHSHSEWSRLQREGRFHAERLDFLNTTVRLNTDDDAKLHEVYAEHKTIQVNGERGSAIGYSPVARLIDGQLITLGHFRVEAGAQHEAHASVAVFYSRSGRNIAVLNTFHVDGENQDRSQMLVVSTNDPIAAIGVGALRMIQDDTETARRLFVEMHPHGGAKLWDTDEGRTF